MSKMPKEYQTRFDRENGISSIIETFGGPDVTQIFVHDVTSSRNYADLAAIVPGIEKYDERALVVARPGDLVCAAGRVDNQYLQFLSSLGIGPNDGNVIMISECSHRNSNAALSELLVSHYELLSYMGKIVKGSNKVVLNPFIATPREFKLATTLQSVLGRKIRILGGSPDIVDYANGKHNVKEKAVELGVPVPEGEVVELQLREDRRPLELAPVHTAINRHIQKTGRVIVRGFYGASGSATVIVENNSKSIQKALSKIAEKTDNSIYLVEVMVDVIVSPNVSMHIEPNNGQILCVSVTDQRLGKNLVHDGNIYPPTAKSLRDMMSSARTISKWLQAKGYSGLVPYSTGCLESGKFSVAVFGRTRDQVLGMYEDFKSLINEE